MSDYIFKMPDIGEGVVEAEITAWHIKLGEHVNEDDPVADAMTDKATVELTAPVSGIVTKIGCGAGEIIAIGADLVVFETDEKSAIKQAAPKKETPKPAPKKAKAKPVSKPAPIASPSSAASSLRPLASPAVRKAAMEADIDLSRVAASGKVGQITHEDLKNHQSGGASALVKRTGSTEIKVTGMRRIIAQRMSASKRNIPHFSYVEAIDMTELEALRAHLNAGRAPHQPKLTLIPFFMRAIVKAVALWPQCNASFDDEAEMITQHNPVHIGMAAQTPAGLMVPVVRHAESLDIWQTATQITDLAEAAKSGSIGADRLSGGTITLTSLGPLGGVVTTPVINRPQVAILGPNKIVPTPVVIDGQIVVRKMMNFSSSFDHRVVDGFHAAEMIQYIKNLLEHPATLFLD